MHANTRYWLIYLSVKQAQNILNDACFLSHSTSNLIEQNKELMDDLYKEYDHLSHLLEKIKELRDTTEL